MFVRQVRQGFKPLAQSSSRFKPTGKNDSFLICFKSGIIPYKLASKLFISLSSLPLRSVRSLRLNQSDLINNQKI